MPRSRFRNGTASPWLFLETGLYGLQGIGSTTVFGAILTLRGGRSGSLYIEDDYRTHPPRPRLKHRAEFSRPDFAEPGQSPVLCYDGFRSEFLYRGGAP